MLARLCAAAICLAVAACGAVQPPPSTAALPTFFYGTLVDNDIGAINQAAYLLGSPARTRNDPVAGLQAAIAVEYLGGELNSSPRWDQMSPLTKMDMLQARHEFRRVLGIRPDAPSQLVVNAEIGAMWALMHGNRAAAEHALSGPLFTQPPPRTLAVLGNLPLLPAARAATASAEMEEYHNG
jgi:hypothetical protein